MSLSTLLFSMLGVLLGCLLCYWLWLRQYRKEQYALAEQLYEALRGDAEWLETYYRDHAASHREQLVALAEGLRCDRQYLVGLILLTWFFLAGLWYVLLPAVPVPAKGEAEQLLLPLPTNIRGMPVWTIPSTDCEADGKLTVNAANQIVYTRERERAAGSGDITAVGDVGVTCGAAEQGRIHMMSDGQLYYCDGSSGSFRTR